jgi:flagellar basal-body rod modification protein FlgD
MSTSATSSSAALPGQSLNQADFLKLLVTQMTSQDPLNPQSDTAFAAQLAQFSALQQSQNMAGDMQALQANSLMGSTVTVASTANTSQTATGVVTGIDMSTGSPEISVNGQLYNLSQITAITPTSAAANTPTTTPTTPATTSSNNNSSPSSN